MTGIETPATEDLAGNDDLRRAVNQAIASVQELRAVAYLMDSADLFGDPPGGTRGRAHRSGLLLITLLERELAGLEMRLMVIDSLVG